MKFTVVALLALLPFLAPKCGTVPPSCADHHGCAPVVPEGRFPYTTKAFGA